MSKLSRILNIIHDKLAHLQGMSSGRYYHEDYVRVYPEGIVFDKYGKKRMATEDDRKNFLNHCKFYKFVAQFVKGKLVADVGCGTGYGCKILKDAGASRVFGSDVSQAGIDFALSRYGQYGDFSVQGITDLSDYRDDLVDLSVSSEVLEHVKEYGVENRAISELKRITRNEGLIVIGTPNSEMLGSHGFSFDEIGGLLKANFSEFCIFENALIPFGERLQIWKDRLRDGRTGIVVTQDIDLRETVRQKNMDAVVKIGIPAGKYKFGVTDIDTNLLHNTHSWVVFARNSK